MRGVGIHAYIYTHNLYMHVVGVMKMGNTAPRAGLETHISGIPGLCATIEAHRLP